MKKLSHVFFCAQLILVANISNAYDSVFLLEDNPLKSSVMTQLRDRETGCATFQDATHAIGFLLAHKVASFVPTQKKNIYTLTGVEFEGVAIKENPVLVSVMRGGLSLLPVFQSIFKGAPVGMIGHKRNEKDAQPMLYYLNLPEITPDDTVVVLEPMLATGGSLSMTLEFLKKAGANQENIIIASVIAAPQGIERLLREYPGITIVLADLDPGLNEKWYIVPGLGDFGDRYFGNDGVPQFEVLQG